MSSSSSSSSSSIPLVDFSLTDDEVRAQVEHALRNFGFMYLSNSGADEEIAALRAASLDFFSLAEESKEKTKARSVPETPIRGYYEERELNTYKAFGRNGPPDYCSQFFMGDEGTGNRFPSDEYETLVSAVYHRFSAIGLRLLTLVLEAYKLDSAWVDREFLKPPTMTAFKVLHYPQPTERECVDATKQNEANNNKERDGDQLRMAAHFDVDALTVLYQDPKVKGGLQINLDDGKGWQDAQAPEGALVVNVGELLKFMSNGEIRCTEHRVRMPTVDERANSDRVSIALFLNPRADTLIRPHQDSQIKDETNNEQITTGAWMANAAAKFRAKK